MLLSGDSTGDVGQIHGPLDDLESFFYVLCNLVCLFERPGIRNEKMDDTFRRWENDDADIAAGLKVGFLTARTLRAFPWWGQACQTLLNEFRELLRPIMDDKNDIFYDHITSDEQRDQFDALEEKYADALDSAVKLFDDALLIIEGEDASPAAALTPLNTPSQPGPSSYVVPSASNSTPELPDLPDTTTAPSSPSAASSPPTSLDKVEHADKSDVVTKALKRKSDEQHRDGASSKRTRSSVQRAKEAEQVQGNQIKPLPRRSLRLRKAGST